MLWFVKSSTLNYLNPRNVNRREQKKYSQIILLPHSHSTQKLSFPKKISKILKVKKNVLRMYIK